MADPFPDARRIEREFYQRDCLVVARGLLGKWLVRSDGGRRLAGRIVEVEAYVHEDDLACHAAKGPTPRARIMWGPPGRAYVYFIYGMHHCVNVVTEPEGSPSAVLIRALEPGPGMALRTDGPGRLTAALGITTRAHNGADLVSGDEIWIEDRGEPEVRARATPRIGVDYAGVWARKPWRLCDPSSAHLSRPLPARKSAARVRG